MIVGPAGRAFGSGWDIALSGMRDATLRVDVAAHNIANLNTDGYVPSHVVSSERESGGVSSMVVRDSAPAPDSGSGTDLPGEIVDLVKAHVAYAANAFALRVQAANTRVLLDLIV